MDAEELLRSRGLRVTRPRLTVLAVLAEGGHLEVEEITARVRRRLDSVSTQAVYDVLAALARAGLARRVEPAGSPARYEARAGDNHHHIVCRSCGQIADVDCVVGAAPCLDPSTAHGFEVDEAEITFWGLCPSCQALRQADTDAADGGPAGRTAGGPGATGARVRGPERTGVTAPRRPHDPQDDAADGMAPSNGE